MPANASSSATRRRLEDLRGQAGRGSRGVHDRQVEAMPGAVVEHARQDDGVGGARILGAGLLDAAREEAAEPLAALLVELLGVVAQQLDRAADRWVVAVAVPVQPHR